MDNLPAEGVARVILGAVYLAEDPALDRRVAIKVIEGYRDHPSARRL